MEKVLEFGFKGSIDQLIALKQVALSFGWRFQGKEEIGRPLFFNNKKGNDLKRHHFWNAEIGGYNEKNFKDSIQTLMDYGEVTHEDHINYGYIAGHEVTIYKNHIDIGCETITINVIQDIIKQMISLH